jgi:DNA-binding MarR family transcriptional regulator
MSYLERMANCPCLNLRRASRMLTAMYNEEMEESGVLITQLPLLGALRVEGSLPLTGLAAVLEMDRTTLSRNLNPIVKLGFVAERRGKDGRSRMLEITPAGTEALNKALPLWDRAQAKVRRRLGKEGVEVLLDKLREIGASGG